MGKLLGNLLGSLFIVMLLGCSATPVNVDSSKSALQLPQGSEGHYAKRKLIKHSRLGIEVEDVSVAERRLESNLVGFGGYIATGRKVDKDSSEFTCRVPQQNLQVFIENLRTLGDVVTERLGVEDVTEESGDKQAELENLYVLRERYRALLGKADSIREALAIEAEIASVQTRIDRLSQSLKDTERSVQYSYVEVELKRKIIHGPVTNIFKGLLWGIKKLFIWN